jgi:hypothetical protein
MTRLASQGVRNLKAAFFSRLLDKSMAFFDRTGEPSHRRTGCQKQGEGEGVRGRGELVEDRKWGQLGGEV